MCLRRVTEDETNHLLYYESEEYSKTEVRERYGLVTFSSILFGHRIFRLNRFVPPFSEKLLFTTF